MTEFLQTLWSFIQIIWGPVVGAVIGYFTNFLAVKMLFRPYKPWKIFGFTLPFTPGIVPRRKDELAHAIGNAVGNYLFTGDDLKDLLLSDATKDRVIDVTMDALDISLAFDGGEESEMQTVNTLALTYLSPEQWGKTKGKITKLLSERLLAAAKDMELGKMIAEQGAEAIREKKSSLGMMALLINDATIHAILPLFADKVDKYIEENGKSLIDRAVIKQLDEYTNRPLHDLMDYTDEEQIRSIITVAYEKLVANLGAHFRDYLDIASVVENKVAAMDPREFEALCMQVMKRELSAVINLGAIIGFVLGLLNIFTNIF